MAASRVLKGIAAFIAIVGVLLALPLLLPADRSPRDAVPDHGLPWQIDLLPDGGSRVFGLLPGRSTLREARQLLGSDVQVALIAAPGETGSLEAYYEAMSAGFVTGKMVLTLETTLAQREQMLQRARKAEYMEGTTRRVELAEADLLAADNAVIGAIAFIPTAALDEQIVLQRFGTPAERIRSGEQTEHYLYPEKGLDLRLDAKGKEVLQYVAPREFARLRDPLLAAGRP